MSRSMAPPSPSTMSKEDIRIVTDVRREIWTSGLYGLAIGSLGGYGLHSVVDLGQRRRWLPSPGQPLSRNTALLSFLLGGAIGSFLGAVTTAKNQAHNLHPIYQLGAHPKLQQDGSDTTLQHLQHAQSDQADSYNDSLQRAIEREDPGRGVIRQRTMQRSYEQEHASYTQQKEAWLLPPPPPLPDEETIDELQLQRNRLFRRASLTRTFGQHGGLSDSHGGHWIDANNEGSKRTK